MLKNGADVTPKKIEEELIRTMRNSIGPFACFKNVNVVEKLPKTRSGKILRRTLRDIVHGRAYSVPGTIEDASVLDVLEKRFGPPKDAKI